MSQSIRSRFVGAFLRPKDEPPPTVPSPKPSTFLDDLEVPSPDAPPYIPADGAPFDLDAVLRAGGVSPEEQSLVDKILTLLHGLPSETPIEVKRQIVQASLGAFGVQTDKIIEAALLHAAAIDRRLQASNGEKAADLERGNRRLSDLNKQVEAVKQELRDVGSRQAALTQACKQQQDRIREVIDFFGAKVADEVGKNSVRLRSLPD